MTAALIGLDWGTTSLRAYLIGTDGAVLDRRASARGILAVEGRAFPAVFAETVGDWVKAHPRLPVLASGMIGSRQGWREAPYCPCPAGLADVAAAGVDVAVPDHGSLRILPGLDWRDAAGVPDVMRGEEVQIFGALGEAEGERLVVLPGTHSKWVRVANGRVTAFRTFMTGELFAVLRDHSILGRLAEGGVDDAEAFARGLAMAEDMDGQGGLLHRLFSARTLPLFGEFPQTATPSYLSGLLIGAEIVGALAWCRAMGLEPEARPLTVVAGEALAGHYAAALARFSLESRVAPADIVAAGLLRVARAGKLIG
ncbi:2-dehydro-3-deoxygalactonokinase [Chelatococcus sp. SYSU_G07232]|uniref:2-dehydro-3-deoxygalactonokinase n=1 Tax=Chelatococcus albus TaxID=3047466 RepID=A0ABT7AIG4_9HYPH|nr:2-dehydro-3-deoxygalactonokinase [Chelatococcus sp. SYSU_G07232]MDJ1159167.1 2-dehydro-3-deoxygalactonokinase [Chelatococcus sp. SYSU_G07232]